MINLGFTQLAPWAHTFTPRSSNPNFMNSRLKKFKLKNFSSSLFINKLSLWLIYKLYKRSLLRDNRCGTKHPHKRRQLLKNKLRHKKTTSNS